MTTKNTTTVVFASIKNRSTIALLKSEKLKIVNSAKRDRYTKGPLSAASRYCAAREDLGSL